MKYAYDLNGQSHPFVMDLPYYQSGGLTVGQLVKFGSDGGATAYACMVDVEDDANDMVGCVAEEGVTAGGTNLQNSSIVRAKVIVNPNSVFNAQWDNDTSYDLNIATYTSTLLTHASKDTALAGGWVYVNEEAEIGQLRFVSAAAATTKTISTAFTDTPDDGDDVMFIYPTGLSGTGVAQCPHLSATFDELHAGDLAPEGTNWIIDNFIEYAGSPRVRLDPAKHAALDGLNTHGVKFTSDVYFMNRQVDHDA